MKYLLLVASSILALTSCEVTVDLDLKQTESKVVIEGQVTDHPGKQYVKVTRSSGFYSTGPAPRIQNAIVSVEDDLGTMHNFVHNPGAHPDSAGIYLPALPFVGEVGRTYLLKVTVDGVTYTAEDALASVIEVDSLTVRINEEEKEDPKDEGKYYELLLFAREPQDQQNFYLFKFYRNDTLVYYSETDIYYSDDEFLAENIDGIPSPVFYGSGDIGRIEMYSLSRVGYVYFRDLWGLLNNDAGGMFGPIPASPRTNVKNGALGFFQVSAVDVSEKIIE